MTVDEIFKDLSKHMIKGLMVHEQMANYYDFLGLGGYKRCHEYHYMKETCSYRSLCRYYINHFNKLIPDSEIENPKIIPDSWYNYTRQDVDPSTKKNAVKNGLVTWYEWERDTKILYEKMYKELMNIGEVAAASKVHCFLMDTDDELKKVERYMLDKMATNYDINGIIAEQKNKHTKYKKKMERELKVSIC